MAFRSQFILNIGSPNNYGQAVYPCTDAGKRYFWCCTSNGGVVRIFRVRVGDFAVSGSATTSLFPTGPSIIGTPRVFPKSQPAGSKAYFSTESAVFSPDRNPARIGILRELDKDSFAGTGTYWGSTTYSSNDFMNPPLSSIILSHSNGKNYYVAFLAPTDSVTSSYGSPGAIAVIDLSTNTHAVTAYVYADPTNVPNAAYALGTVMADGDNVWCITYDGAVNHVLQFNPASTPTLPLGAKPYIATVNRYSTGITDACPSTAATFVPEDRTIVFGTAPLVGTATLYRFDCTTHAVTATSTAGAWYSGSTSYTQGLFTVGMTNANLYCFDHSGFTFANFQQVPASTLSANSASVTGWITAEGYSVTYPAVNFICYDPGAVGYWHSGGGATAQNPGGLSGLYFWDLGPIDPFTFTTVG